MNLKRSHLSFLITFFSMSLVVLTLHNIHLGQQEPDEYVIEMDLLDDETLEKLLEEEKLAEETAQANPIKSHLAFNETAKPSLGDPEPIKTWDEILAERALNSDSEESGEAEDSDSDYVANLKELAKKREENKKLLGEKEAKKEEFTSNYAKRNTSVSYSLLDRNQHSLPIPIYTCIEGGRVVINIRVDALGHVQEAKVNEKSSSTLNGCLVERAIEYALKSRFNSSDKPSQMGTITYLFQSK